MCIYFTFKIYKLLNKWALDYSLGNSPQNIFTGGKSSKDMTCVYFKLQHSSMLSKLATCKPPAFGGVQTQWLGSSEELPRRKAGYKWLSSWWWKTVQHSGKAVSFHGAPSTFVTKVLTCTALDLHLKPQKWLCQKERKKERKKRQNKSQNKSDSFSLL